MNEQEIQDFLAQEYAERTDFGLAENLELEAIYNAMDGHENGLFHKFNAARYTFPNTFLLANPINSQADIDAFIPIRNDLFDVTRDNLYNMVKSAIRVNTKDGFTYTISLYAEYIFNIYKDTAKYPTIYPRTRFNITAQLGYDEDDFRNYINTIFNSVEEFNEGAKSSKSGENLEPVSFVFVDVTIVKFDENGSYFPAPKQYEDYVFNPVTNSTCLFECFKYANLLPEDYNTARAINDYIKPSMQNQKTFNPSQFDFSKPIASHRIDALLRLVDPDFKFKVNICTFDKEGYLSKKNDKRHHDKNRPSNQTIVNILSVLGHYMVIKPGTSFNRWELKYFIESYEAWKEELQDIEDNYKDEEYKDKVAQYKHLFSINYANTKLNPTAIIPQTSILKSYNAKMVAKYKAKKKKAKEEFTDEEESVKTKNICYDNYWTFDLETYEHHEQIVNQKSNKVITKNKHVIYNSGLLNLRYMFDYKKVSNKHGYTIDEVSGIKDLNDIKFHTKISYGPNAFKLFLSDLKKLALKSKVKHKDYAISILKKQKLAKDEYKAKLDNLLLATKGKFTNYIYGHNSGKYDLPILLEQEEFINGTTKYLDSNGILSLSLLDDYVVFKDFYRLMSESLASACDAFELDAAYQKTSFPHAFASEQTLNYVGPAPEAKYWPDGKIPSYIDTKVFDFAAISKDYQKMDCISLGLCIFKFHQKMSTLCDFNPLSKLTSASIAYKFLMDSLKKEEHDVRAIKNLDIQEHYIRRSIHGGRVIVNKRKFDIRDSLGKVFEDFIDNPTNEAYLNTIYPKGLRDGDAISLYPSCMIAFSYPVGEAEFIQDYELEDIMDKLNSCTYEDHAIVEIDYVMNRRDFIMPIIPINDKDSKGRKKNKVYTCHDQTNFVSNSVDIMEYVKYNDITVTKVHGGIKWTKKAPIFRKSIAELFALRNIAKDNNDNVGKALYKLLMVSCYGKFLEKPHDYEMKIVNDKETLSKYYHENTLRSFRFMNQEKVEAYIDKKITDDDKQLKASHLGSFILAYSKKLMNHAIASFDGFTDVDKTLYYMDTDSMIIPSATYDMLINKECIIKDLMAKGEDYSGIQNIIEPDTMVSDTSAGCFHDDLGKVKHAKGESCLITKGYFLAPKLYALEYLMFKNNEVVKEANGKAKLHIKITSKGIRLKADPMNEDVYNREGYNHILVNMDDFEDMYRGEVKIVRQKTFKKTKNHSDIHIDTCRFDKEIKGAWAGRVLCDDDVFYPYGWVKDGQHIVDGKKVNI